MLTLNDFEISDQLLFRRLGNPGITYQTLATELGISKQAIQKQINKAASRYTSLQKEKNRTALSLLELKQQIEKHKYLITRLQRQLVVNSTNHLVISCFNSLLSGSEHSVEVKKA